MNLEDVKALCKKHGEKKVVEYKTSSASLRSAFETICAFLNTKGGTVLIGVKDDGKIVGQHVSDMTRRDIATEISRIEPAAAIDVDYVDVGENKVVIAIHVEAGSHAPYVYDSRPFQRLESKTDRMSQHHYEQLLVKRGQLNHSWESFIADDYDIKKLDHDEIYKAVMDGIAEKRIPASIAKESVEKILRQLSLITDDGKLKQAAVVLFAKEIEPSYTNCWIKMARFKGLDKGGDFIDNQQTHCNVFRMLEVADNFLHKHLPMASYFQKDQFKRVDKLPIPVVAVREALVNAICHRNYIDRAGYISIAIFDDRMEIWSNGTLPKKLKLEDLKYKHDSVLRNEIIAKMFYLRGYIEAWGTGIKKMIDSCKQHGIPAPRFSERTEGLVVTFKFAEPIGGYKMKRATLFSKRQQEILRLLENDPHSSADILKQLSSATSRRVVQLDLTTLERAGLVRREGDSRLRMWHLVKKG